MSVASIAFHTLRCRGVNVRLHAGQIQTKPPFKALAPDLQKIVLEHRTALVTFLQAQVDEQKGDPRDMDKVRAERRPVELPFPKVEAPLLPAAAAARGILESLTARGIRLWGIAGQLRWDSPSGELSSEDLEDLRVHKFALMMLVASPLEDRPAPGVEPHEAPPEDAPEALAEVRADQQLATLRYYQQAARQLLGSAHVNLEALYTAYCEAVPEPVPFEVWRAELERSAPELLDPRPTSAAEFESTLRWLGDPASELGDRDDDEEAERVTSYRSPRKHARAPTVGPPGRLLVDLTFHDNARGYYTIPAGTVGEIVESIEDAGLPLAEQMQLESTRKRHAQTGGNPALVRLDGQVRVLDQSEVQSVAHVVLDDQQEAQAERLAVMVDGGMSRSAALREIAREQPLTRRERPAATTDTEGQVRA